MQPRLKQMRRGKKITSGESNDMPSKIKVSARPCTPIPIGLCRKFEFCAVSTG